jgi:hypothetical protein
MFRCFYHWLFRSSKYPNIWSFVIFRESYDLSGRSHFGETSKHLFICRFWRVRWAKHLTSSVVKTSIHLTTLIFVERSKHLFIWRFWRVRCFEQNILLPLWWKHLNICSSGGFEESYALSKHLTCSVVKSSKHLFIWRFWTVTCFEQNILLPLWWKHLNIYSSDHQRFWRVRCFEKNIVLPLWSKHLNIWLSDHLDLWWNI